MDRSTQLPNDLAGCQQLLSELFARLEQISLELQVATHELKDTSGSLEQTVSTLEAVQQEKQQLLEEIQLLKKLLFGPRRERLADAPNQQHLFELRGDEGTAAVETVAEEILVPEHTRRTRHGHGWNELPQHLPREEHRHELPEAERLCPCCGLPMQPIREDVSEVLECQPAKLYVIRHIYPQYACPRHKQGVKGAAAEPKLVEGGRYGFGVAAEVLNNKFALHLPLYRQQDLLASAGVELSRSTLCDLVRVSAERLKPLAERMREWVLQSELLWTDDTPVPLIIEGGTQQARFWTYLGDESHPYDVYDFTTSRKRDGPATFLRGYRGYLHADAYGGYDGIYLGSAGAIIEVACWAHARRKFFDARNSQPREAHQAIAWIQQLYDLEDRAAGCDPQARLALRQREAGPILNRMEAWLKEQTPRALPKSLLGKAITYARNQWQALRRYTEDGRLSIDNNPSERRLRAQAIGRKNWLFLGSDQAGPRAAVFYTILSSAKRHDLDTWAYLRDVLEQLTRGVANLDDLLPDRWKQSHPEAVRTYRQHEREAKSAAKRLRRQRRRLADRARQQHRD
jgi:transposase